MVGLYSFSTIELSSRRLRENLHQFKHVWKAGAAHLALPEIDNHPSFASIPFSLMLTCSLFVPSAFRPLTSLRDSLVDHLLVPVMVLVIQEPELPIRRDLGDRHAPRVQRAVRGAGDEHDRLALVEEALDSRELLGEVGRALLVLHGVRRHGSVYKSSFVCELPEGEEGLADDDHSSFKGITHGFLRLRGRKDDGRQVIHDEEIDQIDVTKAHGQT